MSGLTAAELTALGGLLVSVTTLFVSFQTLRWTRQQQHIEVFELVSYWEWGKAEWSTDGVTANPILCCHNCSNKSILVSDVNFRTKGFVTFSRKWRAIKNPVFENGCLPCKIEPDTVEKFTLSVSQAIDGLRKFSTFQNIVSIVDFHRIYVEIKTASGSTKRIPAIHVIPDDAQRHYKFARFCRPYAIID